MKIIREPRVYLVGSQIIHKDELGKFLEDHNITWSSDTSVPSQVLCEVAGRVCFDDKTEILTNEGWKKFSDLNRSEKVMTLNPSNHQLEWQYPSHYHSYDYDGFLKFVESADISFCVTPDHRQYASLDQTSYKFYTTSELSKTLFYVLSYAPGGWKHGVLPSYIKLSIPFPKKNYEEENFREEEMKGVSTISSSTTTLLKTSPQKKSFISISDTDQIINFCKFICYYVCRGNVTNGKVIINSYNTEELLNICKSLMLPFKVYNDAERKFPKINIYADKILLDFLEDYCGGLASERRLPRWILNLPEEQLKIIFQTLIKLSGKDYCSPQKKEVFFTFSPILAGQVQEIILKLGGTSYLKFTKTYGNNSIYMVTKKKGKIVAVNDGKVMMTDRKYSGKVYCVTVPNSIVCVRRNGRIHFSGNCYMSFQNPRPGGNQVYLKNIKYQGHGSVLEHAVYNFLICNVSRALTHELVRHRHFSFSQLSQRYVDESVAEYIEPPVIADDPELHKLWEEGINNLHKIYLKIVEVLSKKLEDPLYTRKWLGDNPTSTEKRKWVRQNARIVLPNATETKIFVTANARALRNFLELRCNRHADWEIRKLANLMLNILQENSPNLFGDYEKNFLPDGTFEITTLYRKV